MEDCCPTVIFREKTLPIWKRGRPLFVRTPKSSFNLANFMRVHLFTALGALKVGMDLLFKEEKVGKRIRSLATEACLKRRVSASGLWLPR